MLMDKNLNIGLIRAEICHTTKGYKRVLLGTIGKYRSATAFLNHVVVDHFEEIKALEQIKQQGFVEHLVHKTKDNPEPEYPLFDICFYKFPSYIRRAAVNESIGHVQSYDSNLKKYHEKRDVEIARGHHYKKHEPRFSYTPNSCPTLYKNESFKLDGNKVSIKVFINNTWDWIDLAIPNRDYKRLCEAYKCGKVLNPKLVYAYHKFYLEFPVKYKINDFPDTSLEGQQVLGVDLGFNHGAVCSLVDFYGTVHGRAFSPFRRDTDRICHQINLIRKYQGMSGAGQSLAALYTKLDGLKDNYVKQLSRWIVNLAVSSGAYGIVLEHLSNVHKGKKRGSLKAKVQHWCVARIRDYVKGMAFREGIRVFIINPKGTSMYAYDGSGKVERGISGKYSTCRFQNGKVYNCDLSASYNIAARYFLRALLKSTPATAWSELKAKVPGLPKRTEWTLATLRATVCMLPTSPSKACAA